MIVTDKKWLQSQLDEFETFISSISVQQTNKGSVEKAKRLIVEFKELLGYDTQFDHKFQGLLNNMAIIKTKLGESSPNLIQAATARYYKNLAEK